MSRLPVIVGFGGFNAAGRSSSHHAYRRTVIDSLPAADRQETLVGLAAMMKLVTFEDGQYVDAEGKTYSAAEVATRFERQVLESTLIRKIERQHFDVDKVYGQKGTSVTAPEGQRLSFVTRARQLPEPIPESWTVTELEGGQVRVDIADNLQVSFDTYRELAVKAAGQLPTGFEPGDLYSSRFHPRGLQMAVVAASDAVRSMGIDWQTVLNAVKPNEISVYASSIMAQCDEYSYGGFMKARLTGSRPTAKQLPLGLNSMPADFVNAYVLGNVGQTGAIAGACASFLYNLRAGVEDITSGRSRVAVVGNAEAPLVPEIIEGYAAMSALANDDNLRKLDGVEEPDYRRASRPFGENCGFTIAESAQFFVLMDEELALALGADIHGAVTDVFINADGYKKSISAPGPGNYITMAKAVAAARAILGEEAVREHSFIQAHGSSTPANRVTESQIFDKVAEAFDIKEWPVAAIKSYVGHSLAPASADQLASTLGVFKYGIVPGIKTIDRVADDVYDDHLAISSTDQALGQDRLQVAFLNSKGFGGNNATATIFSPAVAERMMTKRYGEEAMAAYRERRETVRQQAEAYNQAALKGQFDTIYNFGQDMIDEQHIDVTDKAITIPGFDQAVDLDLPNNYEDMV